MSSSLLKFTRTIDGTIPVSALLYEDEDRNAEQEGVGIYDGAQKSPNHQNGVVYVTSHRIFYIDVANPGLRSFSLDLVHVARTDYYAGLFTSSSKVTLHLSLMSTATVTDLASESWVCDVCNYRNPPGTSLSAAKCTLCGVPRSKGRSATATPSYNSQRQTLSPHTSSVSGTPPKPQDIACTACTFLNHPSLRECEICGTPLSRVTAKSAPASRSDSPIPDDQLSLDPGSTSMIKLSFRKGGDKAFYAALRRSLLGKAWEVVPSARIANGSGGEFSGIGGLIRSAESSAQARQDNMQDALADLETLMIKAREMIRLSAELNERLTAISSVTPAPGALAEPTLSSTTQASAYAAGTLVPAGQVEDATFIRSSLAQLGLHMENTPVTLDMIRDEKRWHEELARELAGVLQGSGKRVGLMHTRGIIGIDEVWGGWNRARGVALIPPDTFLQVLPHLSAYSDPPIHVRKFPSSGLTVLHTPAYSPHKFLTRLLSLISGSGPCSTLDIASAEKISVALAAELVRTAEMDGNICRDEVPGIDLSGLGIDDTGEVRWWANIFEGYEWDGQELASS